jgi:hypothetical protein
VAKIIKSLSLDVSRSNRIAAVVAKQYDKDSRFLNIQLMDEGKPIAVESTSVVTINATRADKESKAFAGEVNSDGTVTVPITYWMLGLDDKVTCDVTVVDVQGRKLSSLNFAVEVEQANYAGDDISEDDSEDLIASLLAQIAASGAAGWSPSQISLLETVLSHLVYDDASTGQTAAAQLVTSLRGGSTGSTDSTDSTGSTGSTNSTESESSANAIESGTLTVTSAYSAAVADSTLTLA